MRHFGNPMGGRAALGGMSNDTASRGRYAPLPELPAGSILPAGSSLEFSDPPEPVLNSFSVIVRALVASVTGLGIAFAVFVLLFVKLQ